MFSKTVQFNQNILFHFVPFSIQADQICYSVLCVFSYVAAGTDPKKSPLMQQRHAPQVQQQQQQSPKAQPTHLPQQSAAKLQTIISKPAAPQQMPIQVPLKQAGQPVPVVTETVQPLQKVPSIPERKPSSPSSSSPPPTEPPKMKAPQLSETVKRAQSVTVRGPPPPIPARSGSVQYSTVPTPQTRPIRRQNTMNSAMPSCTPQAPPEFYIPQRRGSITRQQSSSSNTSTSSSKLSK